jgi:hypothetical protein
MKHATAAATAKQNTQSRTPADEIRVAEAQANLRKALDAMARLRETIERMPSGSFPEPQRS